MATRPMDFDLGLWRSTLGDTHPHANVAVDLDYWPQSAHVTDLRFDGDRLVGGFVGCFSGGGGGSQQATFRCELVPLLDAASSRWRLLEADLSPRAKVESFLSEVQRGFEALTEPSWHDQFEASTVSIVFEAGRAAIASTGLERALRIRKGKVEVVSRRLSMLDALEPEERAATSDIVASVLAAAHAGVLGTSRPPASRGKWQTVELDVEVGDMFLLLSGAAHDSIEDQVVEEAIAHVGANEPAPVLARAIGTYLGAPSGWRAPPEEGERATRIRWKVGSRVSIAVLRALGGEEAGLR